jgi:hypothetical protein
MQCYEKMIELKMHETILYELKKMHEFSFLKELLEIYTGKGCRQYIWGFKQQNSREQNR